MPEDHATGTGTRPTLLVVDLSARAAQGTELEAILRSCFEVKRFCPAPGVAGAPRSFHEEPEGSTPSFLPDVIVVVACTRESEIEGAIEALVMRFSGPPIVLVTESSDPAAILRFLRCGVADFITPPLSEVQVLPRVLRLLGGQDRRSRLAMRLKRKLGLKHLVGESPVFQTAIEDLPTLAKCDATVLIDGETGTGKEVCARAIHYLSPRAGKPFVPVNCGAIPLELLENELFGHEGEAYTGATRARPGLA